MASTIMVGVSTIPSTDPAVLDIVSVICCLLLLHNATIVCT